MPYRETLTDRGSGCMGVSCSLIVGTGAVPGLGHCQHIEGGIVPPFPVLVGGHLQFCISSGVPEQEEHGHVGTSPEEATQLIRGKENFSCEDRLKELGLFSLEKRSLQADLIATFQYLKGIYRKDGAIACSERTRVQIERE